MEIFIVNTKNFIARAIACKALSAHDYCDTVHGLYRKACMHGDKIVIADINEMIEWTDALKSYKPINDVEKKVHRILLLRAVRGCEKRTDGIRAMQSAN